MADCAEGEFNRVAGADALPVLCGETEKCHRALLGLSLSRALPWGILDHR